MVRFARQGDGSWKPVTVFLATPKRLQGRTLPGDPDRQRWLDGVLAGARPPLLRDGSRERGTFEDWIAWAVGDQERGFPGALGNGHDTWATEVKPEITITALYEREVLSTTPGPLTRPELRSTADIPAGLLGGVKQIH